LGGGFAPHDEVVDTTYTDCATCNATLPSPTPTNTPTPTITPTITQTSSPTPTPTITPTSSPISSFFFYEATRCDDLFSPTFIIRSTFAVSGVVSVVGDDTNCYVVGALIGTQPLFDYDVIADFVDCPTCEATLSPPLLLNSYPGDSNSYSLRKLDNTYNTNIIEVRRSSDDTTQNIGFVGDNLDTSSLMSFVGTGATDYGYIKTWYSQDVNNRDATQTNNNNQPMIVSGGTLITENGEPTIRFDGSTSYLIFDGTILANTKYSTFQVHSRASSKSSNYFIGGRTQAQNANLIIGYASNTSYLLAQYSNDLSATISSFTGSTLELFNTFNISTGKSIYKSDVLIGSNGETTDLISFNNAQIGLYDFAVYYEGNISEIILYPTDQLSNRTAINTNINNHYNLY
jgi:hypothetical protein